MLTLKPKCLLLIFCLALAACTSQGTSQDIGPQTDDIDDIEGISESRALALDKGFANLVIKHKINTAGVALIKDGELVWQNHYGWQSEGVTASSNTLYDIASLTKLITAETILRLVAQNKLSLDEAIAPYWTDPDLKDDPLVSELTPRMLLSHTSGFANWRYFSNDGKLAFRHPPGTKFGYSGEGFEYLAKYAENKLKLPFERLVEEHLFTPLNMQNAKLVVDKLNNPKIAKPFDEDGKFYGYYCIPEAYCKDQGSYSAAAGLLITLDDLAKLVISAMQNKYLNTELKTQRDQINGLQFAKADLSCVDNSIPCPTAIGYGLGWGITEYEKGKLIGHRGTNWRTVALTYYYPNSGDALIVVFNAPNKFGLAAMVDALELLDPDSPEIHGYRLRAARTQP